MNSLFCMICSIGIIVIWINAESAPLDKIDINLNIGQTRKPPCMGTNEDFECCSLSSPCQHHQGDCDQDSDCAGSLVCGENTCIKFYPQALSFSDCCIEYREAMCFGIFTDWDCCNSTSPCQEGQGDCDHDYECDGSLICGENNCIHTTAWAQGSADCCMQSPEPPCTGTNRDWECCSLSSQCQHHQGDCDQDSDCAGALVCGDNTCIKFDHLALSFSDCCIKYGEPVCFGLFTDWDCCNSTSPCQEGQGDCDHDYECAGSLVCGEDNCINTTPWAQFNADCCMQPPVLISQPSHPIQEVQPIARSMHYKIRQVTAVHKNTSPDPKENGVVSLIVVWIALYIVYVYILIN